jgi:hypothetical protein
MSGFGYYSKSKGDRYEVYYKIFRENLKIAWSKAKENIITKMDEYMK